MKPEEIRRQIKDKRIEKEQIDLDLDNLERQLSIIDSGFAVGETLVSTVNGGWEFKVESPGPDGMKGQLTRPFTVLPSKYNQWKVKKGRA
jgi:hypothetical protein